MNESAMDDNGTLIHARNLVKRYPSARVTALDGLDLDVRRGEFVAISGPSGCGKSTLLNILAAMDRSDAGDLRIAGQDIQALNESDAVEFRAVTIGLVFQMHNLLPNLTALENVQVPMMSRATPAVDRLERARHLLERVGLADRAAFLPTRLSGGERQRVAVARALANSPAILLADEPTGALDSHNAARLLELFNALRRESGMTLVIVTHEAQVASAAERIIRMKDGRIERAEENGDMSD